MKFIFGHKDRIFTKFISPKICQSRQVNGKAPAATPIDGSMKLQGLRGYHYCPISVPQRVGFSSNGKFCATKGRGFALLS